MPRTRLTIRWMMGAVAICGLIFGAAAFLAKLDNLGLAAAAIGLAAVATPVCAVAIAFRMPERWATPRFGLIFLLEVVLSVVAGGVAHRSPFEIVVGAVFGVLLYVTAWICFGIMVRETWEIHRRKRSGGPPIGPGSPRD